MGANHNKVLSQMRYVRVSYRERSKRRGVASCERYWGGGGGGVTPNSESPEKNQASFKLKLWLPVIRRLID